jgi:hypothetical protein
MRTSHFLKGELVSVQVRHGNYFVIALLLHNHVVFAGIVWPSWLECWPFCLTWRVVVNHYVEDCFCTGIAAFDWQLTGTLRSPAQ